MKRCIVNYSKGGWYLKGQKRLLDSLEKFSSGCDALLFSDESQINCPPHEKVPYAFKVYAINKAIELGYDSIIWLDASMYLINSIEPMFDYLENNGYIFINAHPWTLGQWCTDVALKNMGIDREYAFNIPLFYAGCFGLSMKTQEARVFIAKWTELANDGESFIGDWGHWDKNKSNFSDHPAVLGHRHDMSIGSGLIHKMKLKILDDGSFFVYGLNKVKYDTCIICSGM